MPLKKRYQAKNTICKVTFILPQEYQDQLESVHVAGDFNGWSTTEHPLDQLKSGEWKAHIKLDAGQEYGYKFVLNGECWVHDETADKTVPDGVDGENSVVVT